METKLSVVKIVIFTKRHHKNVQMPLLFTLWKNISLGLKYFWEKGRLKYCIWLVMFLSQNKLKRHKRVTHTRIVSSSILRSLAWSIVANLQITEYKEIKQGHRFTENTFLEKKTSSANFENPTFLLFQKGNAANPCRFCGIGLCFLVSSSRILLSHGSWWPSSH